MNSTRAHNHSLVSERDVAWFEELAEAVERGRAGMIRRPGNGDGYWLRLMVAPVCDTAHALISLVEAGQSGDSFECEAAVRRLVKESQSLNANEAATVLVALRRSGHALRAACGEVIHDGMNRLLESQNRDGGWTAVVGDQRHDASCPAVTGRVLEALGCFGFRTAQPPVEAATRFLLSCQEDDGQWLPRERRDAIAATWRVLAGLSAVGFDMTEIVVRRSVRWLKEAQNAEGGWGEGDKSGVPATACAVLCLLTAAEAESAEARAGAEFLVGTQRGDGAWSDATHFPLMALARYASAVLPVPTRERGTGSRVEAGHASPAPKAAGIRKPTEG